MKLVNGMKSDLFIVEELRENRRESHHYEFVNPQITIDLEDDRAERALGKRQIRRLRQYYKSGRSIGFR